MWQQNARWTRPCHPQPVGGGNLSERYCQRKEEGNGRKLRRRLRSRSGCRRHNYFLHTSTSIIEHSQLLNEYVVVWLHFNSSLFVVYFCICVLCRVCLLNCYCRAIDIIWQHEIKFFSISFRILFSGSWFHHRIWRQWLATEKIVRPELSIHTTKRKKIQVSTLCRWSFKGR